MKYKIASFDIFDTCVTRACGSSENFLDVLSTKVFLSEVDESTRQQFIIFRKKAEELSYSNNKKTTIYDIYDNFTYYNPKLKKKEELIKIEIELEEYVIVPVLSIKNKIEELRNSNVRIMFISDMYLPSSILKPILLKNGILCNSDDLFISCETGYSKKDASIFKYIHEREKIEYREWVHYGDNRIADVESPKKLGIQTIYINHAYNIFPLILNQTTDYFNFKYKSILAGISRSLFLSNTSNDRNALITDLIAPLYCSFIYSIFIDASRKNIKKIFFCARDCYQIFKIAQIINLDFPTISIKYLHISREALKNTPSEILLSYFIQEGLASKDNLCAIVDVTTTGQTQTIINNILNNNSFNLIYAYNLIRYDSSTKNFPDKMSINYCRQYYAQINKISKSLFELKVVPPLLESIFSINNEHRTIGYKKNDTIISPIFAESDSNQDCIQDNKEYISDLQATILTRFAQKYINFNLGLYSNTILAEIALKQLLRFFYIPENIYIKGLLNCKLIENGKTIPFVKNDSFLSILKNKGKDTLWDRATIIYSLPSILSKLFIKWRILRRNIND